MPARPFTIGQERYGIQPTSGKHPNHVALDETVLQLNDQRYSRQTAVDSETNEFLHGRLFPARNNGLTNQFVAELREKHHVENSVFLADGAPWLQTAQFEGDPRFQHVTRGTLNAIKRLFKDLKRRD